MKKNILSVLFLLSFIFMPLMLTACEENKSIVVYNMQRIFDIGETFSLGSYAEVKLISGENEFILSEDDYFIKENIDTAEQGIFDVKIALKSSNEEFSYQILVLDFDSITAYYGQTLGQVLLPKSFNLYWKDLNESVGQVGVNLKDAIFCTSDGENVEVKIPVTVYKSSNFWIKELNIDDWTYGQAANLPSAEAKYGEVQFSYYTCQNGKPGDKLENVPVNAGEYFVEAYVNLNGYEQLSTFKKFCINKAVIDCNIIQQEKIIKEYDGSNFILLDNYNVKDLVKFVCETCDIDDIQIDILNIGKLVSIDDQSMSVSDCGDCNIKIEVQLVVDYVNNFIFSNGEGIFNLYLNGEIIPQTPTIETLPLPSEVIFGEDLSNCNLKNGKVVGKILQESGVIINEEIEGVWTWVNSNEVVLQDGQFKAKFTPFNNNFNEIEAYIDVNGTLYDGLNVILADEYFDTITELTREEDSFVFEVCEEISYFMLIIEFSQDLSCTYSIYLDDEPTWEIDMEYWSGDILTEIDSFDMYLNNKLFIELKLSDGINFKTITIELII